MPAIRSRDKVSALAHQPLTVLPSMYKREIDDDAELKALYDQRCRQAEDLRATDKELADLIVRNIERRLACD